VKRLSSRWSEISCGFRWVVLFSAILSLTSNASAASGQVTLNPSILNFGSISVGMSQTQPVVLTNSGGWKLTITQATLSGTDFIFSGLSYPVTLAVGQSVTGYVTFTPQSSGTDSGTVSISFTTQTPSAKKHSGLSSSSSSMVTLPVSGTGTTSGQLTPTPTSLAFGSVQVGSSQTLAETLTNSGGASVTISAASVTGSGFTVNGLSLPITLTVGQSVSFSVTFTATSGSSVSGNLAIASNASNPALNVPLSGTGVTPGQLTANPTNLSFGSVTTGSSATLTETVTNSGGSALTISQITPSGAGFSFSGINLPLTLSAAQSVTFNASFAPQSAGSTTGSLVISSNGSNPTFSVPLSGTGTTSGQLTANPASLSFGSVTTGSSATLAETVTNSGGSALTISQITPSGAGFSFSGINLPFTLSAAQSVTFNASFAPQSAGSVTGSLVISSNGSNPTLSVPSAGTGTLPGQLAVAPSTINFGNVTVGTTQNQTGTLSASSAPVTVSSLGVSGSQFSVSGITLPLTIAAGNSVSFQLTFAPQTSGTASANVTFASNASNSPAVEAVTGSGTLPQHSVALGWNTSTSVGVVGYNIYRGTVSGGPYTRLNSAPDTAPFDTDSTVLGGQTYYYVVTAVDSTGAESSYSSQVQAVIPSP
jgi:hypothetical protein